MAPQRPDDPFGATISCRDDVATERVATAPTAAPGIVSDNLGNTPSRSRDRSRPALAIAIIEADRIVLEAHGDFDPSTATMIRKRFATLTRAGVKHFVVDLRPIASLSPEVATQLIELTATITAAGGSLRLEPDPLVRSVTAE